MFEYISNNMPNSFLNTYIFNNYMPNSRLARQSAVLHVDADSSAVCLSKYVE